MQFSLESFLDRRPITLSPINLGENNISWDMLRLDQVEGLWQGNKIFKLYKYLELAQQENNKGLLSFGGVHSNHLHALAFAGHTFGFKTIGMVRGYPEQQDSPTLKDCLELGMDLKFLPRAEYDQRNDHGYLNDLAKQYPDFVIIPEGGYAHEGIEGAGLIVDVLKQSYQGLPDIIALPVGTGATAFGIIKELVNENVEFFLFCALNNRSQIEERLIQRYPSDVLSRVRVVDDYFFGGFAKITPELVFFMDFFESSTGILLDPVYNLKSTYGLYDMMSQGDFPSGKSLLSIHTGGLQGRRAMQARIQRLREAGSGQ